MQVYSPPIIESRLALLGVLCSYVANTAVHKFATIVAHNFEVDNACLITGPPLRLVSVGSILVVVVVMVVAPAAARRQAQMGRAEPGQQDRAYRGRYTAVSEM